jgi:hypothetical protein
MITIKRLIGVIAVLTTCNFATAETNVIKVNQAKDANGKYAMAMVELALSKITRKYEIQTTILFLATGLSAHINSKFVAVALTYNTLQRQIKLTITHIADELHSKAVFTHAVIAHRQK